MATTIPPNFADLIAGRGLVVLCGAGISMAPPSSLPSWWDFNLAVLQALVRRLVRDTSGAWVEQRFAEVISRREQLRSFTPDFMAQLMEEEVGLDYFRVLQALDASAWNANHGALAGLAAAGVLRAVVTTNFDCLLERALDARQTPCRVFATAESFDALPGVVRSPLPEGLPLIKAHGTVTDPSSMVDTLAQRVAGRPQALEESIAALLEQYPCLMLGFSGADLAYDPDYLGLRPAAAQGAGLCTLVLPGTEPRPPMRKLLDAWGPRGLVVEGSLPEWLAALATGPGAHAAAAPPDVAASSWQERLAERTEAWVDSLGTVSAVNMFTALADANSDADNVLRYLMFYRRYYRSTEDALRPQYWRFEYNLGRRLLDRGLIGTIDPVAAGVVPEWQHDVEATAYVDALQFLFRAADDDLGRLPEAQADLVRLLALKLGHGHVTGNMKRLVAAHVSKRADRANYEAALLAAEFAEELDDVDNGVHYCRHAVAVAHELGDEPRRAAALARAARLLGLAKSYATARDLAEQALRIATDLSLPVVRGDALAARGQVDVLDSRDADAVAPLSTACAIFRETQRRPRLALALCDYARACYYSGSADQVNGALSEALALAERLPGLRSAVLATQMELFEHQGQRGVAFQLATELLEAATEAKHSAWIGRATRALERLKPTNEPQA
jgi:tetratricopeptide (TPR) repeat protein